MAVIPQAPGQLCPTCTLNDWDNVPNLAPTLDTYRCKNCGVPHSVPFGPQFINIVTTNLDTLSYDGVSVITSTNINTFRANLDSVVQSLYPSLYTVTVFNAFTLRVTRIDVTPFEALINWKKLDGSTALVTLYSNGINTAP